MAELELIDHVILWLLFIGAAVFFIASVALAVRLEHDASAVRRRAKYRRLRR